MSIEIEQLSKHFGAEPVLTDINDVVPDGSLTALLGPSGSGKSTLLRMIAGLETVEQGRIILHGRDVTAVPTRDRNIGFCFQDYAPFNQMTVFDNIAYGLKVRKVPTAAITTEVNDLLSLVRLTPFADRFPRQLSGGQRQRMALARALAIKPEVLLLDEPFAALDAQVGGELRQWVRSLQRELGITTILVTHNQAEAMEVADRIVILNHGRIEQVGPPSDVYDQPVNEFVRSFLGPTTVFAGQTMRPHALTIARNGPGVAGQVTDIVRLGFEVRVVVRMNDGECWVQLTHDEASGLDLHGGDAVVVRPRAPLAAVTSARSLPPE
jgi:sulfate transport system ATP-binding protein